MTKLVKSEKPYNAIAGILFFIGIGVFAYMGVYDWLPAMTLVLGITVVIRQLLLGYHFDVIVAIIVFGAIFISSFMQFFARVFLPTFVMLGTIYYIIRQFITFRDKLEVKASDVHIERDEQEEKPKRVEPANLTDKEMEAPLPKEKVKKRIFKKRAKKEE